MKKLIIASLLILLSSKAATAQDFHFDEMTYSPAQTTFKLLLRKMRKRLWCACIKMG